MKITMDEEGCPSTPNSFTLRVQFLVSYLFLVPRDTTCLCLYSYLRTLDLHAVVSCVYSVKISFTSRCSSFLVLSLGPDWNLRVCFFYSTANSVFLRNHLRKIFTPSFWIIALLSLSSFSRMMFVMGKAKKLLRFPHFCSRFVTYCWSLDLAERMKMSSFYFYFFCITNFLISTSISLFYLSSFLSSFILFFRTLHRSSGALRILLHELFYSLHSQKA